MSNEMFSDYQGKQVKLAYLMQLFQFYVIIKKEFVLQQRLEEEIKKLAESELPKTEETKSTLEIA